MKILIAGGTGLVGKALAAHFLENGHEVTILTTRSKHTSQERLSYINWNPRQSTHAVSAEDHFDAVINLAGSSVAKRWSQAHKKSLLFSRISSTQTLCKIVALLHHQPSVFIQASAIGYYASSPELQNEIAPNAHSFLGTITSHWEQTANDLLPENLRKVTFRISTVLSNEGGALEPMVKLTRWGLSSPLASGKQHVSWVHIHDLVMATDYALQNDKINGVYNLCADEVVSQKVFAKTLAKVLNSPFFLPAVPSFVLKFVLGEQACLVLDDQNIDNAKLKASGFTFKYPTLQTALNHLYGKN